MIFVIGDPYEMPIGQVDKFCIFMNYSLVTFPGSLSSYSIAGTKWICRKRRAAAKRIPRFDAWLDYLPAQAKKLSEVIRIPVAHFPVGPTSPLDESKTVCGPVPATNYDICLVGAPTRRRQRLNASLKALGLVVSPMTGVALEEVAVHSKLAINVHAYRSENIELPRILGAIASGTPVLTEEIEALPSVVPRLAYASVPYRQLAQEACALVRNPERLADLNEQSRHWLKHEYSPRAESQWWRVYSELVDLADNKFSLLNPGFH